MRKIYMAGVGGMLGEAFHKQFKDEFTLKCTDIDVNEEWLSYLDFRDEAAYRKDVAGYNPDYLFHIGAYTDLEYCEEHEKETYNTNTKSVENAVGIANDLKIPLLYISTAGIFNGEKEVYDEADKPEPLGHYGRSKYLGEVFVQENSDSYIICRAGWMMGAGEKKDKKFIQKIMKQIIDGKKVLHVVNDKLGTPTYTQDFAKNVKLLVEMEQTGLFNMVCSGLTGRYEVCRELVRLLGLENTVELKEVSSEHFSKEYFAERPPCERLVNKRLDDLGLNIMRDWRVALKEYLDDYYANNRLLIRDTFKRSAHQTNDDRNSFETL
jgi:dTDP-4-dehydrorhamnose reductase